MERAYAWLRRYGRPLELALWEYFFSGGPKENVLRCLAAFQNADGGFGHGLEPDFWLPRSSPMASWMAGQILVDIQADPEEGIVRRLRDYLLGAKQVQPGMWPSVDRKSTRLNSSHVRISYAVCCSQKTRSATCGRARARG